MSKLKDLLGDPAKLEKLVNRYEKAVEENKKLLSDIMTAKTLKKTLEEWEAKLENAMEKVSQAEKDAYEIRYKAEVDIQSAKEKLTELEDREKDLGSLSAELENKDFKLAQFEKKLFKEMAELESKVKAYEAELNKVNEAVSGINRIADKLR